MASVSETCVIGVRFFGEPSLIVGNIGYTRHGMLLV